MLLFFKESVKSLAVAIIVVATFFMLGGYVLIQYIDNVKDYYQIEVDNNKSKACLARKLSEKLYKIESNVTRIATDNYSTDISIYKKNNDFLISQINMLLDILTSGGIYREKLQVNIAGKEDIIEKIPFSQPADSYGVNILELVPKIERISKNISLINELIEKNKKEQEMLQFKKRDKHISLLLKNVYTYFENTHNSINNIYYTTQQQAQILFFKKSKKIIFYNRLKNTLFIFSLLLGAVLGYFIIKRIRLLLEMHQSHLKKIEEINKKLLLSKAEIDQKLQIISNERKKLQEQNKRLENFAYITSHDLQEPLNTIIGFSQILKSKFKADLGSFGVKSIDKIQKSSKRMKTLISELLVYSRLGENEQVEKGKFYKLLAEIQEDLADTIQVNRVKFVYDGSVTMYVYKREMKSLMLNLITNAIKYRKDSVDPVITIKVKETKDYYHFSVADNGIGFDMKHKNKIFDIFQRLHTRDQYSGTGIGLATCKRVVELHKGKIWVESEEGKGSTFYFTISKHLKDEENYKKRSVN